MYICTKVVSMGYTEKQKYLGNSPLLGTPSSGLKFQLKDGSVGTSKLANGSVTVEKLSATLLQLLQSGSVSTDNKDATLEWGRPVTIATIGNIPITVTLPDIDLSQLDNFVPKDAFNILRERVRVLEEAVANYHPANTNPAYTLLTEFPTAAQLKEIVNPLGEKPVGAQSLDMSSLAGPTMLYLAYPISWEVMENGYLKSPVIIDSNGFEQGMFFEDDVTSRLQVDGVTYRVMTMELGKGVYTIEFL